MSKSPKMILLVEDDDLFRDAVDDYLSDQYDIESVESAEAAIKYLEHEFEKPDLVLLDINLPGINGIELLKRIKKCWPKISVIMLTAIDDINSVVYTVRLGASDYMVKSMTGEKLLTKVDRVLKENSM